ncbi:response regulator transcription factor [Arthrobacter sp. Z1-9]
MTKLLIVDDQEMIRLGLRSILEAQRGLELVGDVGDGTGILALLQSTAVDVILLDLRMPGLDGVEITRHIRSRHSPEEVKIIILTTFDQDEHVLAALRAGANGFLSKGVKPAGLVAAIREVAAGGGALSPTAASAVIDHLSDTGVPAVDHQLAARFTSLTAREQDVVIAATTGKSNEQIAAEMFLSPYTVKTHANRAMAKVGARDRAQLVAFAYQAGLVRQP